MSRLLPVDASLGAATATAPAAGADLRRRRVDLVAVNAAMHQLVEDADPAVVFGHLARLCVPAVCDGAEMEVLSGDEVSRSRVAGGGSRGSTAGCPGGPGTATVFVPSDAGRIAGSEPVDYVVRLTCRWSDHHPTPADVALIELLGRCAAGTVRQARQSRNAPEVTRSV